jgi:hypothetical protein
MSASAQFASVLLTEQDTSLLLSYNVVPKKYVDDRFTALVNGATGVLDTLKEIADALGNDANLASTLTNSIANEATTRANAVTTLTNSIANEATTRANAVTTLTNSINSEATTRASADTVLNNRVTTLETKVDNNVASLNTSIAAKYDKSGGPVSGLITAQSGILVNVSATGSSKLQIGEKWRINASNDGKRLIFEYDVGSPTGWISAVPFIQP